MLRAEIESVKSGSQQVDRCGLATWRARSLPVSDHTLLCLPSVKGLETQVAELETEASRLLKGLDSEKESKRKLDRDTAKRIEDLGKDLASKVCSLEPLKRAESQS